MLRVSYYPSKVIEKGRLGLFKGNPVLLLVCLVLGRISFEAEVVHTYSVRTT